MRYSDQNALNRAYELLGLWLEPMDPELAEPERAMTIADALIELGEDRSWASVWWSYGAVHHDLSDAALMRALELLQRVEHPDEARAAALMLSAEVKYSQAAYAQSDPTSEEQRALLESAVALAPGWPRLRVRLARACVDERDEAAANGHGSRALTLLAESAPTEDPFDAAISGRNLDRDYVKAELEGLGLATIP